jgi:hypothetical protein
VQEPKRITPERDPSHVVGPNRGDAFDDVMDIYENATDEPVEVGPFQQAPPGSRRPEHRRYRIEAGEQIHFPRCWRAAIFGYAPKDRYEARKRKGQEGRSRGRGSGGIEVTECHGG